MMGYEACDKDFSTYTLERNYILSTRELKILFFVSIKYYSYLCGCRFNG